MYVISTVTASWLQKDDKHIKRMGTHPMILKYLLTYRWISQTRELFYFVSLPLQLLLW